MIGDTNQQTGTPGHQAGNMSQPNKSKQSAVVCYWTVPRSYLWGCGFPFKATWHFGISTYSP